ncbi:alkyldihydroxyacetonephosphate synthase [Janthinobacterium sp. TND4EL3]|uniref:FAD-binding oxidoreductase n=1 Tax=Janthinobacterium sp. TND4EL3 TaxID=1907311 RepID=UPI000956B882|nr:FAD-binding oxidoreductase [Janthinobacterium sp. TND4EL3]SIR59180.1 alkyldihydroxyacetonephosphate synthase [Janthinobacterium sp. TND4EL3]
MQRWNGWGDESIVYALGVEALAFLGERLGPGTAIADASFEEACAQVPASRLAPHPLIDTTPAARVRHALGQSLPDWFKLRHGRIGAVPDGVAFPDSTLQVRQLLDYARQACVAVIAHGGGTSVAGHLTVAPGPRPVLSINLTHLCALGHLDREAQLATFGAGVYGPDLEAQLRAQGYTLGHYPQSFEYSTLGGWIATRSSGQQSLRYGRIEQLFAGGVLETPAGTLTIPTFPASAAGIDLREMVLGSEGRIGIVTQATVRISPLPPFEAFHAVFFAGWGEAQAAVRALAQAKLPLSLLRLSNGAETQTMLTLAGHKKLVGLLERYLSLRGCGEGKCMLMVGVSGDEKPARAALRGALALARRHKGVHVGRPMGDKWKQGRFRNVYLRNGAWEHGYVIDTVETAVDWPRVAPMMAALEQAGRTALAAHGEQVHAYTHLSHLYPQGASVYTTYVYRLAPTFEDNMARWRSLKDAAGAAIVANGGTISHQHGVGTDHAPWLMAEKGELGIDAMRALLRQFDPQGMMNPGKLLPDAGGPS